MMTNIFKESNMLNIVIPMAGRGSRFVNAGYDLPKPLIPVFGKPMIDLVVNNLRPKRKHRFVFLVLDEHVRKYAIDDMLTKLSPGCIIVTVPEVTAGAASTVLLARSYIDTDDPLMIANSDQWVDIDINHYLEFMDHCKSDGVIMTMEADDPKWSFVDIDEKKYVKRVVEKEVISTEATVGIYNFAHGRDFVSAADSMIANNERVNNEFYVAPAYNSLVANGAKIVIYNVGSDRNGMYGLGIPDDLQFFIQNTPDSLTMAS